MTRRIAPLAWVGAVTLALLLPLCAALHRCGCVGVWSDGEAHCNVRLAAGPHCPWCEHRLLGAAAVALTLGGQAGIFAWRRRRGASPVGAALVSAASLPLVIVVAGFLLWLPTDYPHFLLRHARSRLGLARE